MDEKYREHHTKNGRRFGYPKCCVESFCNGHSYSKIQNKVHGSTGFIPCMAHAQQILKGEITLSDLISNREHPIPFPG